MPTATQRWILLRCGDGAAQHRRPGAARRRL